MNIRDFTTEDELRDTLKLVLEELETTIVSHLDFKQAKILTFWLNDWNKKFLIKEKEFNPKDLIKYKRGNIVNVHLGYNIGSEQGGLRPVLIIKILVSILINQMLIIVNLLL